MLSYEETMQAGASQYREVLDALDRVGLPAAFTQTGGMCAAIEVLLETGRTLLITDAQDSLSWCRAEQLGWGVSLHEPGEDYGDPLGFGQTEECSLGALLSLVGDVMFRRNGTSLRG